MPRASFIPSPTGLSRWAKGFNALGRVKARELPLIGSLIGRPFRVKTVAEMN
jgi:hypothetical protein